MKLPSLRVKCDSLTVCLELKLFLNNGCRCMKSFPQTMAVCLRKFYLLLNDIQPYFFWVCRRSAEHISVYASSPFSRRGKFCNLLAGFLNIIHMEACISKLSKSISRLVCSLQVDQLEIATQIEQATVLVVFPNHSRTVLIRKT